MRVRLAALSALAVMLLLALGVINIANALPEVLAPVCAGIILTTVAALGGTVETGGEGWSAGYGAVYGFSFAVLLLGSVLVTRIRSVP